MEKATKPLPRKREFFMEKNSTFLDGRLSRFAMEVQGNGQ